MSRTLTDIEKDYARNVEHLAHLERQLEIIKRLINEVKVIMQYMHIDHINDSLLSDRPDRSVGLNNLRDDMFNLESILYKMIYDDILKRPLDEAIDFLKLHPYFIYQTYGEPHEDTSPMIIGELAENENAPQLIRAIVDIIRNTSEDVERDLDAVFEEDDKAQGLIHSWYCMNVITRNTTEESLLEYIQAILEAAPSGEDIFFKREVDFYPYAIVSQVPSYMIKDGASEIYCGTRKCYVDIATQKGWPILNPVPVKLNFTIEVLRHNNVDWDEIFTYYVVETIAEKLEDYLTTSYLAQWINQYPALFGLISAHLGSGDISKLENYLFDYEQSNLNDVIGDLVGYTDPTKMYGPLPTTVMSVVGEETHRLKTLTK